MPGGLIELSDALAAATERTAASAVAVHTGPRGSFSGIIWQPGVAVTAEHPLRHDAEIHLTLPDGRTAPATLAGHDPATDLAVLRCSEANTPVTEKGSDSLKAGSLALVVGRTRASGAVAALGVVSLHVAERQTWGGGALAPYIRLDVALQPTAVGGAVVDSRARIAGLATPRFARFGALAIPSTVIDRVVGLILEKGRIPRGYLGVGLQPVRLPDALRASLSHPARTAAIVLEAELGGPAQKAGIIVGDILISLAGHPVAHVDDVHSLLQSETIGSNVAAKIVRGGAARELSITVGERPEGGN